MADFMAVTTCSHPRVKKPKAVERLIAKFYFDPDLNIGTAFDEEDGKPYLFIYGYLWPEAWKLPAGVSRDDFDPYSSDDYEEGGDGFLALLQELAPHLEEPLTIHAVGFTKCRYPLSACEWRIEPGATKVVVSEFGHAQPSNSSTEVAS